MGELARWNRLPAGVALCHIRIIAGGVGAIVPGLSDTGPRAVAIVRIVAVITGAGILAVIPIVRIVSVIPIIVVGKAVTPPIRRVDPSEPEPAAEMPKAMVEPAAMKPTAVKAAAVESTAMEPTAMEPTAMEPTAMEPTAMEPTAMEPGKPAAVKTPAATAAV